MTADAEKVLLNGSNGNGQAVIVVGNGVDGEKDKNGGVSDNVKNGGGLAVEAGNGLVVKIPSEVHCNLNGGMSESCIDLKEPPDGGWRAWLVMVSAFLCNGVIFGVINTYSVTHSYLQTKLEEAGDTEASSKAALVGSLTIGTTFLFSPIAGVLTDKIGLRLTTFIGGVLCTGGMVISSYFTHDIEVLCLSYGVMFGLGAALSYTPTLAILGHYFKRYLGKVSGFVTAGSSIFTAIMPPGLTYLLQHYGISVMLRVVAVIASFMIVCSVVYKPLHPPPAPPRAKPGRSALNLCMRSIINVDIWKRKRYVIWALSVPLALFGYFVPYVHMVKFVQSIFPDSQENLPVMCVGISSGLGRLIFGFISDIPGVNRLLLQQIALIGIGVLTILLPVTNYFVVLLVFAFIMGLFDGCFITLIGPIAFELCGARGATQAIGFLLGLSSIPLTVGPVVAGKLYDKLGSYTLPFMLAGIPPLVGASLIFITRCVRDRPIKDPASLRDGADVPLAKTAWNSDKPAPIVANGNGHLPNGERKASLATAESMELEIESHENAKY